MKSQAIGVFDHGSQQKHIATCLGEMIRGQQKTEPWRAKLSPEKELRPGLVPLEDFKCKCIYNIYVYHIYVDMKYT